MDDGHIEGLRTQWLKPLISWQKMPYIAPKTPSGLMLANGARQHPLTGLFRALRLAAKLRPRAGLARINLHEMRPPGWRDEPCVYTAAWPGADRDSTSPRFLRTAMAEG